MPMVAFAALVVVADDSNATTPIEKPKTATIDPHFWLDPERMAAIAEPLAAALAEAAPEHRTTLLTNAKTLSVHLRGDVMPAMHALLAASQPHAPLGQKPDIPFITYHAAYHYFLSRFNMADDGTVTMRPEDYLGAKTLNDLLVAASKQHIRCLIAEDDSPLVRRVAKAAAAKIVILSPEQLVSETEVPPLDWIKNGYDRLLYKTAKSFAECL